MALLAPYAKDCLGLIHLTELMAITGGNPDVMLGLIDGPVAIHHPDLASDHIREIPGRTAAACTRRDSVACTHGTFVAGILSARRGSPAPAICPGCTLIVRPLFVETTSANGALPEATPDELATAILDCIAAGARAINLSVALTRPSAKAQHRLEEALDHAARRGVIVVAAAGNQGTLGSSAITRHPWVIPVVACDQQGRPLRQSNLGSSIARQGLSAPGEAITSLSANGGPMTLAGTSMATPFVTGAIGLLWSVFPAASAAQIKLALTRSHQRRATVVPPLLDAWDAHQLLKQTVSRR